VDKIKGDEASFKAQAEIQKNEIKDLRKQLAETKEKCGLAEANQDISEYWKNYLEKTVEELRASKERCFEKSLGCVEKIKASFANVGAYSNKGVIEWISVAEPPELFQLKCLSLTLEVRPHLNRNKTSVPWI
jgi:Ribonuclease G/E